MQLPRCGAERAGEGMLGHGIRILAFLLRENVTATLTDLELERAEYAAAFAVTAREILPVAVDRISAVRHVIARVLKDRCVLHKIGTATPSDSDQRAPEGPMARLQPRPIQEPPAGGYAEIRQADRIQF